MSPRGGRRARTYVRWRELRNSSGRSCEGSRGAHEDRSTGAPEAGCPGPTVKPDARISRRDGRDARPCPRTRHTPRRTGTAHVCQHPTTSPAPATLRHFRVVSFELVVFVLRSPGSSTAGTPWLRETRRRPTRQSQEAFSTLHPLPAAFERAARAPRHCPGVPTMHHGSRSCPGLEHENHHTSAATESSTEGQRPPERDPHE